MKVLRRLPDYRAPSWSWASVEGEVLFHHLPIHRGLVEFLDIYTAPVVRSNPYGAIQNSWIPLVGWVIPIFHRGCGSCELQQGAHQAQKWGQESLSLIDRIRMFIRDAGGGLVGWLHIDDREVALNGSTALMCLEPSDCFLLAITYGKTNHRERNLCWLILAAVASSRGVYQRIGMYFKFEKWAASTFSPQVCDSSSEQVVDCLFTYLRRHSIVTRLHYTT
ncbi:hypothetical protein M434DRAFT_401681 [Hypoxylon sp. CO27-5]|nr:hypothetical protein M434DRAFT_401681 [Hypoxylon sp. CO27-5]